MKGDALVNHEEHSVSIVKMDSLTRNITEDDEDEVIGMTKPIDRYADDDDDPLLKQGKEDSTTVVTVSVSIYYTKEFAAMEEDVQGYIDTCFQEANAAMANSKIPMRLKHHGTYLYEGKEIFDAVKFLDALDGDASDGDVDDIWYGGERGEVARKAVLKTADATLLLQSDKSNVGGIAYTNTARAPISIATHAAAK